MTSKLFFTATFILFFLNLSTANNKGYYRFPSIAKDVISFTSEGDIWLYNQKTNTSARLTTSSGLESNASLSPDGTTIAYNAEYEGITEVYSLPINGGIPKRITYEGLSGRSAPKVINWINNTELLLSTSSNSTLPNRQLIKINTENLETEMIPLSQADEGTYDEQGNIYFTRLPFQGSQTKRYKGGTAQNIWKFDGQNEAIHLLPDYLGTSKNPMYYNSRIYFLTDRDGTMNIWSMNLMGTDLKQHTKSIAWDIKDAELFEDKIIYQLKADLHLFSITNEKDEKLDISLISDFDQRRVNWIKSPLSKIESTSLSNDGKQVAITARGRVFTTPAEGGRWTEVTRNYGIRHKYASFIGTSDNVVFLSDQSGEMEFWKTDKLGTAAPVQLTTNTDVLVMNYAVSPNGKYIAYIEKDHALKLHNIETEVTNTIDIGKVGRPSNLNWSNNSKFISYVDAAENQNQFIKVYQLDTKKTFEVSSKRVDSYNPCFSADDKWLYFLSDRTFNTSVYSPWGSRQPEPFYNRTTKIYALALVDSLRSPFIPDDELTLLTKKEDEKEGDETKKEKKKKEKDKRKNDKESIAFDFVNISDKLIEVPVPAHNIFGLSCTKKHIYWIQREINEPSNLKLYSIKISNEKENKPIEVADKIRSYELSANGKKLLIRKKDGIYVLDANGAKVDFKNAKVDLKDWIFKVDPVEDWQQLLVDAWRLERDYFYDKNMHGVNWDAVLERHLPLVKRVSDRYELDDLIAHMVSELSALHTFVYGGDKRKSPDKIDISSLGADLIKDKVRGGYVIKHIYNGDPDYPEQLSPLSKHHLKIATNHIIKKVNGVDVLSVAHINTLLNKKAGQQVLLDLSDEQGKTYQEGVHPITMGQFSNLRYNEWEYSRRIEVDKKSDDQIGYLHLRAMGGKNYQEFVKGFYPVYNRAGLIIDVRHNRGGNIDSWVLEKLLRKEWFFWQSRSGTPTWNMQYAFRGHVVVLCNEKTASDGEAFAEGFKRLGLGKVIGTRTWGGEIWLSSSNRLVDGGIASASEFGVYTNDDEWIIEGHGVEPDMIVDNLPYASFNGEDAQLNAAIDYLQKLIEEEPVTVPDYPPFPDKSFEYPNE
ncbi:MAG: S41 family peptidase [Prolixibacteraceae bacterium]|jgi:tricorn protease|nr:S41 family peptidase [Prolixibacteraceae bacterium]